jgi:predicted HTH transcriptional regulator
VFNTTEGKQSLEDSFEIRRTALMMKIPYYTTAAGALAAAQAIAARPPQLRSKCGRCRATPKSYPQGLRRPERAAAA